MAANILNIDPRRLSLEDYSFNDLNLISNSSATSTFIPSTDYIEYFVYGLDGTLLYPVGQEILTSYTNYSLEDNDLVLNPENDLINNGFSSGVYNTFYNFLSNRCNSSPTNRYFISEISTTRTEIRLTSNTIKDIIPSVTSFIEERNEDLFFPDFYLNFGENQLLIANNIALDGNTILIKLYEPLPPQFDIKSTCYIVEEVAEPKAYNVTFTPEVIEVDNTIKIQGPNLNLNIKDEISNSQEGQDWLSLTGTDLTSSSQQVNSYFNDPNLKINVDYNEYSNFINFSSVESRINNFFYKLKQIESWTTQSLAGGGTTNVTSISSSTSFFQNKINETIDQFDNFEYYLYYSSGSTTYPKTNSTQPYQQTPTTSSEAQTWITSSLTSGSDYDVNNVNWIYYSIPEYIREDSLNAQYVAFCNMVGHFYDENIWVYIKDITNKWDNDNRIDSGISRDLIAQQLRDLGFNLYENQFSSFNIYSSILGITPSGSYFPFPDMTGSLPTPSGFEYVNASITGSNEILPQDDVNKRLYKRIYNNLPYLYKKKGTIDGIRTLATIYGIPNTLLRIDEFGGKDKDNTNDWDYWFNQFNYKFDTLESGYIESEFSLNNDWSDPSGEFVPNTVQFRFKTPGLGSAISSPTQSLWRLDTNVEVYLQYTGSGFTSGSYSGSISNSENEYANLILSVDGTSGSIYLPFFDGNWWSVEINREAYDPDPAFNTYKLLAGNSIYNGNDGSSIGFTGFNSFTSSKAEYISGTTSTFANISTFDKFSGSLQEIRYYIPSLSQSIFDDYVMNPQSIEGNTINSAPDGLVFRASLGGELYTGSESIHPKVTGSWTPITSFSSGNSFTIREGRFTPNREYVFMDQPAVGIKNRITDKIKQIPLNLPEGAQQLSNIESIQQDVFNETDSYTPNVDLLEVSLSPTNQINDDIINSIGYLNIGEYIGDPRQTISGSTSYPDLDALRDEYFLKYTGNYDWNDFIRLIKFFDNSLFKLIKDFVPAKTSLASGITIKQHLLERQKYPEPSASYSDHKYTGSIKQIPGLLDGQRIYSASNNYESFPILVPTGSQGGTLPNLAKDVNYTLNQIVNVTQSWEGSYQTPFGFETFTQDNALEFIDGEFSGSDLIVTTQSLNPNNPILKPNTITINYKTSGSLAQNPADGELIWEFSSNPGAGSNRDYYVTEIYINEEDLNGVNSDSAIRNLSPGDKITFDLNYTIGPPP